MGVKRYFIGLMAAAYLSVSCGPSTYVLSLDKRQDSESGLNLYGKSLSVLYLENRDGSDSLFNNRLADAFAYSLEEDFFDGSESVNVYSVVKDPSGNYASKDTLSKYVMSLNTDVVMMLDTPKHDESKDGQSTTSLYIYDSMWKNDDVVTLDYSYLSEGSAVQIALKAGTSLSMPLMSIWKTESYSFMYYEDMNSKWIEALDHVYNMEMDKAISLWMNYTNHSSAVKRASAMYNIAMACYLSDENELAEEWLDNADKNYSLPLSPGLRKRIALKK